MNSKDYYGLLGIDKNATENDIKKAYRKLAMEFHPDINADEDAEEKFKAIGEAYAVLSDRQKRQVYDFTGNTDFTGFPGGYPGFGPMAGHPFHRGRGMGRCMGRRCGGMEALFRRRPKR